MRTVLICFILLLYITASSQKLTRAEYDNILESWIPGEIVLSDGTRIAGDIQYNQYESTVRLKRGDHIKAMQPKDIQTFTIWDEKRSRQRKFFTIPFDLNKSGTEEPTLFEALVEFEDFALMSTISKLTTVRRQSNYDLTYGTSLPEFEGQQTEYIYIFDSRGLTKKYMTIEYNERSFTYQRMKVKRKVHDSDLLKEYIPSEDYVNLEVYAEQHRLSFKKRPDLIRILDQYKRDLEERVK